MPKIDDSENKSVPLMIRMPPDLHAAIKQLAVKNRRSLNAQCIVMLEDAVKRSPDDPAALPHFGGKDG